MSFYERLVDGLLGRGLAVRLSTGNGGGGASRFSESDFFRDIPIYITENGREAADMVSYSKRFGLTRVNYRTRKRTVKDIGCHSGKSCSRRETVL